MPLRFVGCAFEPCDSEQEQGCGKDGHPERTSGGQVGHQHGGAASQCSQRIKREHGAALAEAEIGEAMGGVVLSGSGEWQ